jgi:dihydrolipoamide dehydrogenase
MDAENTFDVVVIGAGPGGYVCAIRAAQLGYKTAIIDKQWLGGVCLNVGCIPTKALLKNAEVARTLREGGKEFGFSFDNLTLDYAAAVQRSRKVSERLTKGVALLMKNNNVQVFMGSAKLTARDLIEITAADGQTQFIQAAHIVIATGSHSMVPPGWEIDGEKVISFQEAILQERLPASAVIIGAGAIGVEFASIWNAYGSQVTVVEMLPGILPLQDEEISAELDKQFRRRKIKTLAGHRVLSVSRTETGVEVVVSDVNGGEEKTLQADQALVAIGFRPNSANLGLETTGVEVDPRGFIVVDEKMATNVPGIYAIGDVTGKLMLAHTASAQAMICAEAMAGKETRTLDYRMIPGAVFSSPQVASFGWTEKEAAKAGLEVRVGRFPFLVNGKALGLGENVGFVKLIAEAAGGKIIGAHMIGPDVSELLPELTLAADNGLTAEDIGRNVHTHPTLSEVLMEAAHVLEGHAIHI